MGKLAGNGASLFIANMQGQEDKDNFFLKRKMFTYTIFVIFTFKVSQKFISWASRKTKMPNCIFFPCANHSEAIHGGTFTTSK